MSTCLCSKTAAKCNASCCRCLVGSVLLKGDWHTWGCPSAQVGAHGSFAPTAAAAVATDDDGGQGTAEGTSNVRKLILQYPCTKAVSALMARTDHLDFDTLNPPSLPQGSLCAGGYPYILVPCSRLGTMVHGCPPACSRPVSVYEYHCIGCAPKCVVSCLGEDEGMLKYSGQTFISFRYFYDYLDRLSSEGLALDTYVASSCQVGHVSHMLACPQNPLGGLHQPHNAH